MPTTLVFRPLQWVKHGHSDALFPLSLSGNKTQSSSKRLRRSAKLVSLLVLLLLTASACKLQIPTHHHPAAADDYKLGPDSMPQEGVPRGEVTKFKWESKIFPGTV